MKPFLLLCLLLIIPTFPVLPALAQNPSALATDPQQLQQQGLARTDRYIEHFRKTGDLTSLRPELEIADQELAKSVELFLQRGDQAAAAFSLIKRGNALRLLNQWEQAAEVYKEALRLARQADKLAFQAKALMGMGRTEVLGLKQFDEAARHFQEAAALSERSGDKEDLANALDNLAQVQEKKGELTAASDTINRAAAVAEELKNPKLLLFIYMDRGSIYLKFAEQCDYKTAFRVCFDYLDQSKADYTQFLKIAQDLGYQGLAKYGQQFLGSIEARRALLKHREGWNAKVYTDNLEKLFQPQGPKDVLVNERFITAPPDLPPELHQQAKKDWTLAEATGQRPAQNPRQVVMEGDFLRFEGKPDEALAAYLKAVELLERDRGRLGDEEAKGSYMADKIDIYYRPIPFLLEQRRYAEAFDLLERSKSRALVDLLATRDLDLSGTQGRELYAQYRFLKADIARLQKDLLRSRSQPGGSPDPAKIAALERQILDQEKKFQNLETQIGQTAPRLQELLVAKPVSLQKLQESMRGDDYEVIEYMEGNATVIVWHITADAIQVKSVFLPPAMLEAKVKKLRASISDEQRTESFDPTMARQLFLYLIEPVKADIKKEHLVIIPHGVLNHIPFQVLQDPADGRFAGERWQISYAPNATILEKGKKSGNLQGESLLAVADPQISEAPKEVEAIAALFPGKNKQVTGTIQEADLKSWAGDYSVLHLSVHGKFEAEPLLSYLVLNKDTPAEWHLTAAAMFGLPLAKAKLVVLSACETGQVEATHANELYGMIRALIYAGANTLILSSWRVDAASTRVWMEAFYKNAQTQPLAEAARQAILAVKKQPQYQHPFYWAPFLMFGK